MAAPLVVIGLGQLGSFFRDAFVARGREVLEVRRDTDVTELARQAPSPDLTLVAVGEDDLEPVLSRLPAPWRSSVALLQNELRPAQWERHVAREPSVAIVWFERKAGRPPTAVRESVLWGGASPLLEGAIRDAGLPVRSIERQLLPFELAAKNLYILTLNLCGLETQGSSGELLERHPELFDAIFSELLTLERAWFGPEVSLERPPLESAVRDAVARDPAHAASGRSAPRRLARAVAQARAFGLELPHLERLSTRFPP